MPNQAIKRLCDVEGCERSRKAYQFCNLHYQRWRRFGDPLYTRNPSYMHGTPSERFWAKVDKNGPEHPTLGPCWVWMGALKAKGYGHFTMPGRSSMAHRFAYEDMVGRIPDGFECDHLCNRRSCVRPSHIAIVEHSVNVLRSTSFSAVNSAKTHCSKGHAYAVFGRPKPSGGRTCRECERLRSITKNAARRSLRDSGDRTSATVPR